ncbi:MAG: phosphate ABC transporter permease PstA, partial [Candidatus Electrothrix sp. AR3]|nr:phosphate ABC transporter permease PstA [Candidatus Electrothrix sp. AR3]
IAAINWQFFTELPTPPGLEGGGVANAIIGTVLMTALATVLGVPAGLLAGVYLAEFGKHSRLGAWVRFTVNMLMGIPSIIIGLFVYSALVFPFGHFSGFAGGVSLAILMFPVVARTTEDMLSMVPNALREAALSIGNPRWMATLSIIFRAAKSGLITGVLLSVARVSGETAPLLFTALNSPYMMKSFNEPIANLTVTIYQYAMSPYDDWNQVAWGASLVIMMTVLLLNLLARFIVRGRKV